MDITQPHSTTGAYIKTLKLIHLALQAGQVFFIVVAFFLRNTGAFPAPFEDWNIFLIAVLLITASAIGAGLFIFKQRMDAIAGSKALADKLTDYRAAAIVKYALAEGPSFFAVVAYLLTGNMIILGIAVAIIAYFATMWPTVGKMSSEMNLTPDEKMKLENQETQL